MSGKPTARKHPSKFNKVKSVYAKETPKPAQIDETKCCIQWLFHLNLDHILEEIFLMLSLEDLERCKTVCKEWNRFMRAHIWGSRSCMKTLYPKWKARLDDNWDKVGKTM